MKCKSKNSNKCNIFANLFYWQRYWERMLGKKVFRFQFGMRLTVEWQKTRLIKNGNLRKNAAWKTVNSFSARIHFIWKITTFLFFYAKCMQFTAVYGNWEYNSAGSKSYCQFYRNEKQFLICLHSHKNVKMDLYDRKQKKMLNNKKNQDFWH